MLSGMPNEVNSNPGPFSQTPTPEEAQSEKTLLVPVLLAFFFGPLGFHRILVGRWKSGLFMMGLTLLALSAYGMEAPLVQRIQAGERPESIPGDLAMGTLVLLITTVWASVDGLRLALGRFRDAAELRMRKWT